jgi:TRAP-type C4-dicarboxylate transport system permease small subunit
MRIWSAIDRALLTLSGIMVGAVMVCVCLQVWFRFVMDGSVVWAEELSRYLFVWAVFLTTAVLAGRGEHYGMPEFVAMLTPRWQRPVAWLANALCILFCVVVAWYGARWAWRLRDADTPVLELPQGLVYSVVPLCAAYMALRLAFNAWHAARRGAGTPFIHGLTSPELER